MKKLFALMIALVMLLSCAAIAEEGVNVEVLYEGEWVEFSDDGFLMYIPAGWVQMEIDEETLENSGIYYAITSPDGSSSFQLAWSALEEEMDMAALLADIQTAYPTAKQLTLGATEAVCYANAEADIVAFAVLDQVDLGVFYFNFTPASSKDMITLASLMMTSITPMEAAA